MMLTLADFLMARIVEDEARANFDPNTEPWMSYRVPHSDHCDYPGDSPGHCTCRGRDRALADCLARRRIVRRQGDILSSPDLYDRSAMINAQEVLESLGAVHADHPDYREEWRP